MQELAAPGMALMSAGTLRQVEGFMQVNSLGPVQAKGISQPVEAYSLIGTTSARTRVQAGAARGLTPLVGRNTEIDIFNKLVEQTTAGRGQILAMVGEPGMGKSRLVHEFTRHRLPPGWLVLEGASVSYGKATPYFPLIEMLRRYFQIGAGEGSEHIRTQVVTHILELDSTLTDTIPPILSLLSALPDEKTTPVDQEHDGPERIHDLGEIVRRYNSMDPQQRRRHTLDALKRLFIRESQRQNLLLVFEDLHWIDYETQAFLDGLVDSLPMARLLLLVNYRPEYNHLWSEKSYYTLLRVDPLQTDSAEELLSKLLGNNPDLSPLKQLLVKRTEGNPFFAEESVRSLVETLRLLENTANRSVWMPGVGSRQVPLGKAMGMVWEVETYRLAGAHTEAEALARRALAVFAESKHRGSEAWLHCLMGDLLTQRQPADLIHAEASYKEALSLAQDLGMRPLQARCYLGLGQIHAQSKNASVARSELHVAAELYRAMGMPFWLARADLVLAAIS